MALVIDALILWRVRDGAWFWLFWVLGVLGAIGTSFAAIFLRSWWLMGASLVALVGLLISLTPRSQTNRAAA